MDNTPITPAVLHEADGAMIYVPQAGRTGTANQQQLVDRHEEGMWGDEYGEVARPMTGSHRLNSPRTGSGPYTPVPHITVREIQTDR